MKNRDLIKLLLPFTYLPEAMLLLILVFHITTVQAKSKLDKSGFSINMNATAQFKVTGVVTDESGIPLPGANIVEKGTSNGVTADFDGNFSISITNENAILVISYIGYKTLEVPVEGQTNLNIVLSESAAGLDEVVVVGYGTQKKATLTGAISQISTEEVAKNAVADLSNSIGGRLPGVFTFQVNGEPGDDAAQIYIRGQSSLNDNSPLVLVDGVQRDFNHIDPNNIESMSVLKDASATAVYGVRGANGVILITTKRGTESKPRLSYTGYYGFQSPTRLPDYLGSYDYARLYNEALINDGVDPADVAYTSEDLQKYKDGSDPYGHPNNNYYKETLRADAPIQRHSFSLSGGTKAIKYYTSFGLLDQDAIIPNINFTTYNFRANIDADITKSTKLSVNLAGEQQRRKTPGAGESTVDEGFFSLINYLAPDAFPLYNEDGSYSSLWGQNPIAEVEETGYRKTAINTVQTSFNLNQKLDFITEGLAFKLLGAYDIRFLDTKNWYTPYKTSQLTDEGYEELETGELPSLSQDFEKNISTTFEASLTYNRTFGKHEISGLFLYTQFANYNDNFGAERVNYQSSAVDQLFAGPTLNATNYGTGSESGREGYVGRITYAFDQRYLLEANFGYNGSDNFPEKKRYGFFPSGSVGWILSNEKFFRDVDFIDYFKIRASYGEVGNDKIADQRFLYKQLFTYGDVTVFGGDEPIPAQTISGGTLANNYVTWEKAKKTNFGIDIDLLNGLLGLNADIFFEKRDNILGYRDASVPETFGAELPAENIASVQNRGFEISLSHKQDLRSFQYSLGGNFTFARNKILYIDEPENVPEWQLRTGRPMGQFFGYVAQGLYQTQEQIDNNPKIEGVEPQLGQIMYKDIDGDGVITPNDVTAIGRSRIPEIIYGINLNLKYKNIDFSTLLQGTAKSNVYFGGEAATPFLYGSNALSYAVDRWTPDNPNSSIPRLTTFAYDYLQEDSSYWLRNGAYLRIKNVELGYTLPKNALTDLNLENLRLYVSATNPVTWAKFKYWDPEAPGFNNIYYPQMKVYSLGLNVTF